MSDGSLTDKLQEVSLHVPGEWARKHVRVLQIEGEYFMELMVSGQWVLLVRGETLMALGTKALLYSGCITQAVHDYTPIKVEGVNSEGDPGARPSAKVAGDFRKSEDTPEVREPVSECLWTVFSPTCGQTFDEGQDVIAIDADWAIETWAREAHLDFYAQRGAWPLHVVAVEEDGTRHERVLEPDLRPSFILRDP